MNMRFKIVSLDLDQHSIIVRYYTDKVSEEMLCTFRDPVTGAVVRCSTDYNLNLPIPAPQGEALREFIRMRAPTDFLRTKEAVLDPNIDTTLTEVATLVDQVDLANVPVVNVLSPLEKAKKLKLEELAVWRYANETRGVTVGGVQVRTDRESQATLTSALVTLREGFVSEVDWKGTNGWVKIQAEQLTAIASAVAQHVQQCFSLERMFSEQIDAATTVEEVNALVLPLVIGN